MFSKFNPLAAASRRRASREQNQVPDPSPPAAASPQRNISLPTGLVQHAGVSSTPSPMPSTPALTTPLPNGARKVSTEAAVTNTPSRYDSLKPNGNVSSPQATSPLSPASGENSPAAWSSAVGPATTSGKSGRVIERLMSENDKLKRDLNEQMIRCHEFERTLQTYKPQIEALRHENDNLTHLRDVDSNLIARRDRRIDELKAELANEKHRRETAESLARQREREKEEIEEKTRREIQQMTESSKHATVHAEILETSHRQLRAEYRARVEAWKKDLRIIDEDRQTLARLDVVAAQVRQELEKMMKTNADILASWLGIRNETQAKIQFVDDETERTMENFKTMQADLISALNELKWATGLAKVRQGCVDGAKEDED